MASRTEIFSSCGLLRIFAGTWNVSQEKASPEALRVWLEEPAASASLVCIGLQEMEMGAGSIGLAAVKETVSFRLQFLAHLCIHFLDAICPALDHYRQGPDIGERLLILTT